MNLNFSPLTMPEFEVGDVYELRMESYPQMHAKQPHRIRLRSEPGPSRHGMRRRQRLLSRLLQPKRPKPRLIVTKVDQATGTITSEWA